MKKTILLTLVFCAVVVAVLPDFGVTESAAPGANQTLPASLDDLYPPNAPGPLYLVAMHELNNSLAGMVCDLFEQDAGGVRSNLDRFKSEYLRVSKLVPEWEGYFPAAPVSELETAMTSGDPEKAMPVMDKIDAVCHGCHMTYTPAVQFKYHWDRFNSLSVTDPATNSQVGYKQFKLMMNTDMVGIGNDLAQGQVDNARRHAEAFSREFESFRESCAACHDTERTYYVSDDVRGMISTLRAALDEETPDPASVGQLLQGIGQKSCFGCHLVHEPAAYFPR